MKTKKPKSLRSVSSGDKKGIIVPRRKMRGPWTVYMLECGNGAFYTGITNDLDNRIRMHSSGRGAKYTRIYGVKRLVYTEKKKTIQTAMRREREIKKLTRVKKELLLKGCQF